MEKPNMSVNSPKDSWRNRSTYVLLGSLLLPMLLIVYLIYTAIMQTNSAVNPSETQIYRGTDYEPPLLLQDFTLTSHTGEPLSLSDLRGQVVLLFFGFTHCPDVCPLTLAEFKRVKSLLGEQADDVGFVFISVDSERDTPEVLANYIGNFDADFIALTGDETTLRQVGQDFGVQFERTETVGETGNYAMEHTARSYLIDAEVQLRVTFAYGTDAATITIRTRELLPSS